jgi:uncharacterized OsmC-like protein
MTATGAELSAKLTNVINGIGAAVEADVKNAAVVFKATGVATEGVKTDIQLGDFKVVIDEPPMLGGDGLGANPVEYALASLLSCQVITYRFWAAKLGIELGDISAEVEGDFAARNFLGLDDDPTLRAGFSSVRVNLRLSGPESPERYQELKAVVDRHCPVLDLFANPTPVHTVVTQV